MLDGVDLSALDGVSLAVDALLSAVPEGGYVAVMAYLDRLADASAAVRVTSSPISSSPIT